ncbi:MAG: hypothetical protein ACLFV8_12665 [Alphaproteobacteria bacterium]
MEAKSTDYIRQLRRFSKAVLIEAYDDVLRTWNRTQWPPPGLFYTRCSEIVQRDRRPPEQRPAELDGPARNMKGVPLARVDQILDEHPNLSPHMRVWLRNLAIAAGAGVEGEDRTRQEAPPIPARELSPEEAEWKRRFEERKRKMFPPQVVPGSKYVP